MVFYQLNLQALTTGNYVILTAFILEEFFFCPIVLKLHLFLALE